MDTLSFADRINKISKALNKSQAQIAAILNIDSSTISSHKNKESISPLILKNYLPLTKYYNINPKFLEFGTGNIFIDNSSSSLNSVINRFILLLDHIKYDLDTIALTTQLSPELLISVKNHKYTPSLLLFISFINQYNINPNYLFLNKRPICLNNDFTHFKDSILLLNAI